MENSEHQSTRPINYESEIVPSSSNTRLTGTGDYPAPWVIELRVMGTPSVIQSHVNGALLIGRADHRNNVYPEIDLEPFDGHVKGVSRRHATIYQHQNRLMIRDLASANGTALNEMMLEQGKGYRLRHGDTISIGTLKLQIFFAVMPSATEMEKTNPRKVIKFEIPQIGKGMHVLIADGDVNVALVLKSVLEQADFRVSVVNTFQEAISIFDTDQPQILLSELLLPDNSGMELFRFVRERSLSSAVPIMVITNTTGGYQLGQAIDAGADTVLSKPVGIDELLRGLTKFVAQLEENKA